MADEPHGSPDIVHVVLHLKYRRASMNDGKNGVSVLQKRRDASFETRLQCLFTARLPATAHDPDDSQPIGLSRSEDLHRQGQPELAAVDHVGLSRVFGKATLNPGQIA